MRVCFKIQQWCCDWLLWLHGNTKSFYQRWQRLHRNFEPDLYGDFDTRHAKRSCCYCMATQGASIRADKDCTETSNQTIVKGRNIFHILVWCSLWSILTILIEFNQSLLLYRTKGKTGGSLKNMNIELRSSWTNSTNVYCSTCIQDRGRQGEFQGSGETTWHEKKTKECSSPRSWKVRMFQVPPSRFHCHLLMCFEMLKHIPEVIIHPTRFYEKGRVKFCQRKHPFVKYLQGVFFNWYPPKKLKYGKPRLGVSTLT